MKKLSHILIAMVMAGVFSPAVAHADNVEDSSIESIVVAPTMKSVSGGIEISANDDQTHHFYVYSITGQMIKSVDIQDSQIIDLPQGCYIVKCSEWSKKIVVR